MSMMKYVSIDIETTGLDPETCQILEIGAVIEDWVSPVHKLPTFHCLIEHDLYVGQARALAMNNAIFDLLASRVDDHLILYPGEVAYHFKRWLASNNMSGTVTAAGKNFAGFDLQFLRRLPDFNVRFDHRTIDPAMLYWQPEVDEKMPSMATCLERASLDTNVLHVALDDATQVIHLIRRAYDVAI